MRTEPFALPLKRPLSTAHGEIERREGFLLRERGGLGEATPLPGWTESLEACSEALAGGNPSEDTPAARHAVSLVEADADARNAGDSLAAELGSVERRRVPVNATIGDGTTEETAAAAREAIGSGYGCLKVKVGARSLESDCRRLGAVRDAAPDAALRLDANAAYDTAEAAEALERFAAFDPEYVEQPVPPGDLGAVRGAPVRLAADESLSERAPDAVLADGADVLVLKPMALGGLDRTVEAAAVAAEHGAEAVVTTTVDGVVARLGALHAAATFEGPACGLATADLLQRDLGPDPAPVRDGAMEIPDREGLGVNPAEVSTDA